MSALFPATDPPSPPCWRWTKHETLHRGSRRFKIGAEQARVKDGEKKEEGPARSTGASFRCLAAGIRPGSLQTPSDSRGAARTAAASRPRRRSLLRLFPFCTVRAKTARRSHLPRIQELGRTRLASTL